MKKKMIEKKISQFHFYGNEMKKISIFEKSKVLSRVNVSNMHWIITITKYYTQKMISF